MRNAAVFLCVVLGLAVCRGAEADADRENHAQAAKDFKFEGLGFPLTKAEFLREHSNAIEEPDYADKALGTTGYIFQGQSIPAISALFFGEKMYEMRAYYDQRALVRFGGSPWLLQRLIEKIGQPVNQQKPFRSSKPNEEGCIGYVWSFKDRFVMWKSDSKSETFVSIWISDTVAGDELFRKRRTRRDVGF